MFRHGLRLRMLTGASAAALLLYLAVWLAVMMVGLFGGPIDYRATGSILLVTAGAVLLVGVPLIAVWVLASRSSPGRVRPGWRLIVLLALSLLVLVGVVAVRGVISPFAPVATRVAPACAALDAAGLAAHWPADTRTVNEDKTGRYDSGPYSICSWYMKSDAQPPAPYVAASARVTVFDGSRSSSGLAAAIRFFRTDADDASALPTDDIGDEAYTTESTTSTEVVALRANAVVRVEFLLRGDSSGRDATTATGAARDLAARIVAGVEVS
jgi:hypothetical protein